MIYETSEASDKIKQGDIFRSIPRVDLSFSTLAILEEGGSRALTWKEKLADAPEAPVVAALPVQPVTAIVITQDCDTVRGEYFSLCQIDDYLTATGKKDSPPKNAKGWQSLIKQHARTNLRWFYLPADPSKGITNKSAADFRVVIRVSREDLEKHLHLRLCRLNSMAREHFRETLGQFFRRYAYDEWYPMTKEEFEAYSQELTEDIKPFPWQT